MRGSTTLRSVTSQDALHQDSAAAFPHHWEADVVLRDGSTAHVRPITPNDRQALQDFHTGQSQRSIYMRFFAAMERLSDRDLERFTTVDHHNRVALIATATLAGDSAESIIGVARFDRIDEDEAEVAFNISDSAQGRGLGSVLLEHIADAAREVGVRRFTAEVLPQNGKMLSVFREAGYATSQEVDDGIVTVWINLDPTEHSLRVMAQREYRAEAKSMQRLYNPRRILLVGSLTDQPTREELRLAGGALSSGVGVKGEEKLHVLGLNPVIIRDAQNRHGVADNFVHYDNLTQLLAADLTFDLAIVAVSDNAVGPLINVLATVGVQTLVVLSEGFAETGSHGLVLQKEMLRGAHSAGMRVVGPASYGVFSNTADVAFNASLTPELPKTGPIGLFTQSAAMAVTLLTTITRRNLGVSNFLSAGNRADISGNDLLQYWHDDQASTAVGLYLESIGNPRKFSRVARRLSLIKPVVVVSAGQSGQVVPRGHAVRRTQTPRKTLEQMFRQSGVIRADNTHEMVDTLQFFATQPLPQGKRVGILATSEALAAIAAESVRGAGLQTSANIFVLPSTATPEESAAAIATLYAPDACDVVVFAHVPTVGGFNADTITQLVVAAHDSGRPTLASVFGLHGLVPELSLETETGTFTVPAYSTPEDAIRTLKKIAWYAKWTRQEQGARVDFQDVDVNAVRKLVADEPAGTASAELTAKILAAYGISVWPAYRVHTVEDAITQAELVGWPVALKSTAESLRHRADLGGVRLNISTPQDMVQNFSNMVSELSQHLGSPQAVAEMGFEIQAMAPSGVACVLRSQEDELYGPVVSFGLSGDAVDLLGDVTYGVPPLNTSDVSKMVRSIGAAPRLFGYKGIEAVNTDALEELIGRVSQLADTHPRIRGLELYPVVVSKQGAAVISAHIELQPADRKDGLRRALPN